MSLWNLIFYLERLKMQISKISQPMCCVQLSAVKAQPSLVETNSNSEMTIPDNYGRALVNFRGAGQVLCKQDKVFLQTLGETLSLPKEKGRKLAQEFKAFLAENGVKSLNEVKFTYDDKGFNEECEFIGVLTKRISEKLGFNEKESDALNLELVKRMDEGEEYIPGGKAYLDEMQKLEKSLMDGSKEIYVRKLMSQWDEDF